LTPKRSISQFRPGQNPIDLLNSIGNPTLSQFSQQSSASGAMNQPNKSMKFMSKKAEAERIDRENKMMLKKLMDQQVSPHLKIDHLKKHYD